ncbi:SDR family oxidoreductase [Sphingomonas prati]|uniref:NAD(P)-dependent dehydrogenase (Short-subunit alcohol dehydrogenase family) n=1 Tax=Sphingomonas prati TaxID=1843237 RepID=A0A7W9F327_9SPHN|nr:SDR family oxidoreductase [Sphingomonas prati]MBB5729065.1 NAD(P)-dependent dehydrogenase (short-subunit alcohol dehydrogenase family) [Sphingomonas prati]GGE85367.1 dehydrogenase [Sphingomonas prati]
MTHWTSSDIPPQNGRTAVITGTGGLGYQDALMLARAGGDIILAGRDAHKGADAVDRIRSKVTAARIRFVRLDLANLASVASFAERLGKQQDRVDLLINNAGVMVPPRRQVTADGFELQFGTNHLGHFALTAQLLPLLRKGRNARVISLSSVAAPSGAIDFANLNAEQSYKAMPAYSQSKLACLMFAFELQRRSEAGGWGITSIAAHPGVSRTDLLHNGPGRWSVHGLARSLLPFLFQPAAQGALPTLFAATSDRAKAGGYYGPDRMGETRGYPTEAGIPPQALDEAVASRLWDVSEALTGVRFAQGTVEPQLRLPAADPYSAAA